MLAVRIGRFHRGVGVAAQMRDSKFAGERPWPPRTAVALATVPAGQEMVILEAFMAVVQAVSSSGVVP